MPIMRNKKHQHNYIILDKTGIEDTRLSFRARGLLTYLLTKPDGWEVSIAHLSTQSPREGRDAIAVALQELEAVGYARKTRQRAEHGHLKGYVTIIYETPTTENGLAEVGKSGIGESSTTPHHPPSTDNGKSVIGRKTDSPNSAGPKSANPPLVRIDLSKDLKESKDLNKPPLPPTGGRRRQAPHVLAGFEAWWSLYPTARQFDKAQCLRLWKGQALEGRAPAIQAHTAAMATTDQWRKGVIPSSVKYLKEARYETEVPPSRTAFKDDDGFTQFITKKEPSHDPRRI